MIGFQIYISNCRDSNITSCQKLETVITNNFYKTNATKLMYRAQSTPFIANQSVMQSIELVHIYVTCSFDVQLSITQ
jgi:hypothetical protein